MSLHPEVHFIRSCHMCPHMKRITLENIAESLRTLQPRIDVDSHLAEKACLAVNRMLEAC